MNEFPTFSPAIHQAADLDDALFHYTSAQGLIGVVQNKVLWSTAYFCTNDEEELKVGKGILVPALSAYLRASRPQLLTRPWVDLNAYAEQFEKMIIGLVLSEVCTYITCFCRASDEKSFHHGLLSQWRAYGEDGGYAIQFSRKKLQIALSKANEALGLEYDLRDVHYDPNNPLQSVVLSHGDKFGEAFVAFIDSLDRGTNEPTESPLGSLTKGPLESLFNYLTYTKSGHFSEEREVRLSLIQPNASSFPGLPAHYINRRGLIVPYRETPQKQFRLLDCIEAIIIGPNSRMGARYESVCQMARQSDLEVDVRRSEIPFCRG
jgi:hypothetical protein